MKITVEVKGTEKLIRQFDDVKKGFLDLRQLGTWDLVQAEFYKIEKKQFASEGGSGKSGKWSALTPRYKAWKDKHFPGQPILQLTGKLMKDMTSSAGIVEKRQMELTLGTRQPYAQYHQRGTFKMKARPILDLTEAHEKQLTDPIRKKLRQLAYNAGLARARGY